MDVDALTARGLIRRSKDPVKVLGEGDAPANLTLKVNAISSAARQKVEAAGGQIEIV